ncbi:MAG TPA: hypothetical protein GXZ21_07910 [Clostridiales bacterium]|nr:hypothetical protein [Clostridiales bacterium]
MREINPLNVFVQYRDIVKPCDPLIGRKYTITHSDTTADLFVFVASNYADDKITDIRDEVRVAWEQHEKELILIGSVTVSGYGVEGNANIRNSIFYKEMPIALQALRLADRFLFDNMPKLDDTPIFIHFISSSPVYNKMYDFGTIGDYK